MTCNIELFSFRKYCLSACEVEEPELKFNIDQYTDLTLITKPVIYISVQEIVDTHQVRKLYGVFEKFIDT